MVDQETRELFNRLAQQNYEAIKNDNDERRQEISREIGFDTYGADCIGTGGGRSVFDLSILGFPNECVKFAVPHPNWDGVDQNQREVELWDSLSQEKRDYLVEVLDYGSNYYWLIMPQGDSVSELPYQWLQDAKYHLRDVIWDEDMDTDNIVKINGEYKFCDYGVGP